MAGDRARGAGITGARDLGINETVLRRCMKELEQHGSKSFPGNGNPIEEELARLRKENETLRQEREILDIMLSASRQGAVIGTAFK